MQKHEVTIIGGGLAGSEAAYKAAALGARAVLYEMKPKRFSPAHSLETLGELVCSNSLKSELLENSSGLLKEEMRQLGSLVVRAAHETRVPAGKTLAVDRAAFSAYITDELQRAGVEIVRDEAIGIPKERPLVIATGPLTSDAFACELEKLIGSGHLHFYDAVAPIVYAESIDMEKAFRASRYGKGGDDYINCPLSKDEYETFVDELLKADIVEARSFEDAACFEGCMPIEVMARRGLQTLAFGPMRPVGIIDPKTGKRPHAVVQLRMENIQGTLYNIVGFQTRLRFPDQKRVFRLIPGLERAEFARFGKLHRNSFLDAPKILTFAQQFKADAGIVFAGQITGVEGYCESAASGIIAGINAVRIAQGRQPVIPPEETMTGALLRHVTEGADNKKGFQPMNANFGLLPPLKGKDRKEAQAKRALEALISWKNEYLAT